MIKPFELNDSEIEYTKKIDNLILNDSRERIFQDFIISRFLQHTLSEYDVVPVDTKLNGKAHNYSKYCGKYGYHDEFGNLITKYETPDLCVAKNWKLINNDESTQYITNVEIKTPFSENKFWISPGYSENPNGKIESPLFENKPNDIVEVVDYMLKREQNDYAYHSDDDLNLDIKKQIGIHLRGCEKLIVTDGIRWIFFFRDFTNKCNIWRTDDLGIRICRKTGGNFSHVRTEWFVNNSNQSSDLVNLEDLKKHILEFCEFDIAEYFYE